MIVHPKTQKSIDGILASPPHALQIIGSSGAGKDYLATYIAQQLLGKSIANHPYYLRVEGDPSIGIETIRSLHSFLQLKTTGTAPIRRVIHVTGAHNLTAEAQNALLKTLEEPPKDTILLLSVDDPQKLYETIHSRTQKLLINPVTLDQAVEYFTPHGFDKKSITLAHTISSGQAGLMSALLRESDDHELALAIQDAKKIYALPVFERLIKVDDYSKDKHKLELLLAGCKRICSGALSQAAARGDDTTLTAWHNRLAQINNAQAKLLHNSNTKLLLTDLFMSM